MINTIQLRLSLSLCVIFCLLCMPIMVNGQTAVSDSEFYKNYVKYLNEVSTNAGSSELITLSMERIVHNYNLLLKQQYPDGTKISNRKFKKLMKILKGGDKVGQALEEAKRLAKVTKKLNYLLKKAADIATIVDVGSKTAGYLYEGDYSGAMLRTVSGTCKWGSVTLVTSGVTYLIIGTGPVGWGAVAAGTATAFTAEYLYDLYIDSWFHKLDRCSKYVQARIDMIGDNLDRVCSKIKDPGDRIRVQDAMLAYMHGGSYKDMKKIIHPFREKMKQAIQKEADKKLKEKELIVLKLRELETSQPKLKKYIDIFEKGEPKLKESGQVRLLLALQREYGQKCKKELSKEYLRGVLRQMSYPKIQKVMKASGLKPPEKLYRCLCNKHSIMGNSSKYKPGCVGGPCTSGNWGKICQPFPSDSANWESCLAATLIGVEKDKNGKIINPGIRIDEYIAGKRILQEITK